jgi:nickel/cobalt transporter (NicO) family protein
MTFGPELLLIGAVALVGVLHTVVPDHWVPITLIARQRGWSMAETARASLMAGTGHVVSTLAIAFVVWIAGVGVATRFGQIVDAAASIALIGFGGWIAISAWREVRDRQAHGHNHAHDFTYLGGDGIHGPELQHIDGEHGELLLSIYEAGVPSRFRLTGADTDRVSIETVRPSGSRQAFEFENRGTYWESVDEIPEPHDFNVKLTVKHGAHEHRYNMRFVEHEHGHHHDHEHQQHEHDHASEATRDPLYARLHADPATLTQHAHTHRHHRGHAHAHLHDHLPETAHLIVAVEGEPPLHEHRHKMTARTALLVILGSSPMVEGIPAFFAAAKYGVSLIVAMSVVFALSTIVTYVVLCVYSTVGLQRIHLGAFERYGEVLSGGFIALVGVVFWVWPVL